MTAVSCSPSEQFPACVHTLHSIVFRQSAVMFLDSVKKDPIMLENLQAQYEQSFHKIEFHCSKQYMTTFLNFKMAQSNVFNKLCSLGEEGDRRQLLTELFSLMASKATPITVMPVVCRQTVDLFKLYNIVKSYGGLETVCKMKQWRDVSSSMGFGGSTSAGFALKKTYCKYLFTYECKYDRNDADPTPILVSLDLVSKLETKKKAASTSSSVDGITKEDSQDSFHELTNNHHNSNSTSSNHNNFNTHLDEASIKHQVKAKEKTVFFNYNDDFSSIRNRSMGMVFDGTQNKIQTFPVENVMKRRFRRRKIYQRDIVRVDLRKVGLALTSGMLAEVSWAIDYLAVFTHDPVSPQLDISKHPRLFQSLMNLFVLCMDELVETMRERNDSIKNGKLLDIAKEKEFSGKDEVFIKKEKSEEDIEFMVEEIKKEDSELEAAKEERADGDNVDVADDKTFNFCTHTYNTFFGTDLKKNHPCLFSLKGKLDHKNVFYNPVHHHNGSTKKIRLEYYKEDKGMADENDKIYDENKSYEMTYLSTTQPSQGFPNDSEDSPAFCRAYLEELSSASALGYDVTETGEDLFNNIQEKQDLLARRCICISNVLRNLGLQAVNEREMATSLKFITLASHFLLFDHQHPVKQDSAAMEAVPDLHNDVDKLWWSSTSSNIRSNFIVALSSIATHISLFSLPGDVCMQLCSGLLHWAICQSSEALDLHSGLSISIQRIVFETLTKLCIQCENTDFLLATPPFSRLVKLVQYIVEVLYLEESEVERDILLGLLSRLVEGDSRVARILVIDGTAPLILIGLIENYMNTLVMREQSKYMEGFNVSEQFHEISAYTACKASEIFRTLTDNPENASLLGKFRKHFLEMSTNDLQDDNITANICHVIATLA